MAAPTHPRRVIERAYYAAFDTSRLPGEQYTAPPGDPGLFGPGSAIWYLHADVTGVLGGVHGLILGSLHPVTLHGTNEHSAYDDDPMGRLGRTASFVQAVTYGPTPVAEKMIAHVRNVHERITGTMPDGRPYAAGDSDLLTWVYATQAYGVAQAHLRYHPHPLEGADLDSYYADYALIARKLGARGMPVTRDEVEQYFRDVRPQLAVNEATLDALRFLTHPAGHDATSRAAARLFALAALDLLPAWARRIYGLTTPAAVRAASVRPAMRAMLAALRHSVGEMWMIRESRQRCAATPAQPARI